MINFGGHLSKQFLNKLGTTLGHFSAPKHPKPCQRKTKISTTKKPNIKENGIKKLRADWKKHGQHKTKNASKGIEKQTVKNLLQAKKQRETKAEGLTTFKVWKGRK